MFFPRANFLNLSFAALAAVATSVTPVWAEAQDDLYTRSLQPSAEWNLPADGPKALESKRVIFVAATLRNSGILGVAEGLVEASKAIGWEVDVLDARGSDDAIMQLLDEAVQSPPDGLVLGGFDAKKYGEQLNALSEAGTSIVGWHAGPLPGAIDEASVFFNVTTDPLEVAKVAALHAIETGGDELGVVIFTDERFEIALAKSDEMARLIEDCAKCQLLETVNVRLDETATQMPVIVDELLAKHGDAWTVSLGINDLYFDDAVVPLSLAGVSPNDQMMNISAGDGSLTAYQRIRLGNFQAATVPEPLVFQGWQIIDELNRSLSGEQPSGFVAPTKLVVEQNVDDDGGLSNIFDPENGYQQTYASIWFE